MLKALTDAFARNRRWIGGLAFALWLAAGEDKALVDAYPRFMKYAGVVASYILASGLHNPDRLEKLKQEAEKVSDIHIEF